MAHKRSPDITFVHVTGPTAASTTAHTSASTSTAATSQTSASGGAAALLAAIDATCYPETSPEVGAAMRAAAARLPQIAGAHVVHDLAERRVSLPYPSGRPRVIAVRTDEGWHVTAYPDRTGAPPCAEAQAITDGALAGEAENAYATTVPVPVPVLTAPSGYAWFLTDVTEETGLLDPPIREGQGETFEAVVREAQSARRDAARNAAVSLTATELVPHLPSGTHESTDTYDDGTRLHLLVRPAD